MSSHFVRRQNAVKDGHLVHLAFKSLRRLAIASNADDAIGDAWLERGLDFCVWVSVEIDGNLVFRANQHYVVPVSVLQKRATRNRRIAAAKYHFSGLFQLTIAADKQRLPLVVVASRRSNAKKEIQAGGPAGEGPAQGHGVPMH